MNLITILIIVNVFAALAIIALVLMQQSKGDMGSAFGGGGSQSMFGSRGSANFLTKTTSIMCTVFFLSSLALAYSYAQRGEDTSVVGNESVIEQSQDSSSETPSLPAENTDQVEQTTDTDVPALPESTSEGLESKIEAVSETAEQTVEESVDAVSQDAEESVDEAAKTVEQASDGADKDKQN